jgi:hypothetical protein
MQAGVLADVRSWLRMRASNVSFGREAAFVADLWAVILGESALARKMARTMFAGGQKSLPRLSLRTIANAVRTRLVLFNSRCKKKRAYNSEDSRHKERGLRTNPPQQTSYH